MCLYYGTLFLSSSNENKQPAIISAVSFTLFIIWSYRFDPDPDNEHSKLGVRLGCKFLATIISVSPGDDIKKWDYIAACMNQYLQEEHFFYGKECMKFFNEEIQIHGIGQTAINLS
ncbi:uncharacterized protein ZBAI_02235 [Zygosaccharomyces bailii ISA1307]|nr:uncharacterized protein ZBAI_02235 [Zygosaccharomyces bailii ISA1307]